MSRVQGYHPGSIVDQIVMDIAFEKKLDDLERLRRSHPVRTIPRHNDVGYERYLEDQAEQAVRKAGIH